MMQFLVPGEPVPKARARTVAGRSYTPKTTVAAEERVRSYFKVAYPSLRASRGPFEVSLSFSFRGIGRGDWDNYAKLVCDALQGVVWVNDRQIRVAGVVMLSNCKQPATVITIRECEHATPGAQSGARAR